MSVSKNILIIEDDKLVQSCLKRAIRMDSNWKINVIPAYSIEEAEKLFEENKESIDVIAFDWFLEKDFKIEDTLELIEKIKNTFSWIMIAMSSCPKMQSEQIQKWCTHSIESKSDLPDLLISLT